MRFLGWSILVIILIVIGLTLLGAVKPIKVTDRGENGNVRMLVGLEILPTPTPGPLGGN